jgi:hypothetical protein
LPLAGFTVSIQRLALLAAKKNYPRNRASAQDSYKLEPENSRSLRESSLNRSESADLMRRLARKRYPRGGLE